MKRILVISYHTCPLAFEEGKETGGMNVYVYELSKCLASLGYQVDVITRCQDKNNDTTINVVENFRVIHLVAGPHGTIDKKKLPEFIPEFVESFEKFTQSEKINYDLIHAHYYQSGIIAEKIQRLLPKRIPLVMTFHTLALMKNLVARSEKEMDDEIRVNAEMELMKISDGIIAPSFSEKQYMKYLYEADEEKIYEIPPGVNTEFFRPINKLDAKKMLGLNKNEKNILFVGRIEPLKGIDMLLYAIKILIAQDPNLPIRLLIVGGDISQNKKNWAPQLKLLERLSQLLKISKYVDFVGQQQQKKLPYFYNSAEVVVMPSHYESFGIAAAEAMACGVPVITTNVTGISNLIDSLRSTLITTVNNPLLLASQIKKLLSDEKIYQEIKENIMETTKELHWSLIAKRIGELYDKLIGGTSN